MAQVITGAILDTLDDVDEAYHGMFTERNGKFEFDGVGGLKTQGDIDRLSRAAATEREAHKVTKAKLTAFGELDPETVHTQLDRVTELELAAKGKLDEGELDKIVEGRLATKLGPIERNNKKLTDENQVLKGAVSNFEAADVKRTVLSKVGDAIKESKGFNPAAVEDVNLRAERIFELNEDGTVTAKDGVGVTPGISPSEWLIEMQTKSPHWWGDSSGGGARPPGSPPDGTVNPFTHESWNMTEQGKLLVANRGRAEQLAKAAGTTIGGRRPPPKK